MLAKYELTALRRDGRGLRLGRLRLHAVAAALGRRGLRAGGRRLTAGFAFLVLAKSELTALRRDGRGLRLRLVKKRRSSEDAAAEGRFLGNSVS